MLSVLHTGSLWHYGLSVALWLSSVYRTVTAASRVQAWFRTVPKTLAKQIIRAQPRWSLLFFLELVCLYANHGDSVHHGTHHKSNK